MNMFARFNENPAMTLQDIKETKPYGPTHGRTEGRTDNMKTGGGGGYNYHTRPLADRNTLLRNGSLFAIVPTLGVPQ